METNWLLALWTQVVEGSREQTATEGASLLGHLDEADIDAYVTAEQAPEGDDWRNAHLSICDSCLASAAAAATLNHLSRSLDRITQWPRIGLSAARGGTPYLVDGQTPDGWLRWRAAEDAHGNCCVFIATDLMELERRRIRVEAGKFQRGQECWKAAPWSAECLLQRKSLGADRMQLGGEVVVTKPQRRFFSDGAATLRLTLVDRVAQSVDLKKADAVSEMMSGEMRSRLTRLVRAKVYGIPADLADELIQKFVVDCFVGIARTYDPTRDIWPFVRVALVHYCNRHGPKLMDDATTKVGLDEARQAGWEPSDPTPSQDLDVGWKEALAQRLVASLSERDQRLIGLRFNADLTCPAIAVVTGHPVGSVQPWIFQALRSMRDKLTPEDRAGFSGGRSPAGT